MESARALCFLMKDDNISYEVVLGVKKGKKEQKESNLNLIESVVLSCLIW